MTLSKSNKSKAAHFFYKRIEDKKTKIGHLIVLVDITEEKDNYLEFKFTTLADLPGGPYIHSIRLKGREEKIIFAAEEVADLALDWLDYIISKALQIPLELSGNYLLYGSLDVKPS